MRLAGIEDSFFFSSCLYNITIPSVVVIDCFVFNDSILDDRDVYVYVSALCPIKMYLSASLYSYPLEFWRLQYIHV